MQKTLVVVDSKNRYDLLTINGFTVFQDYKFLKKINRNEFIQQNVDFSNSSVRLLESALDIFNPLFDFAQAFHTIVLVVDPGNDSDFLAGLLALLFDGTYKKIVRVKMYQNTALFLNNELKKIKAVTPDLFYAECADYWANRLLHNEFLKIKAVKGIKELTHIKQALLLRFLYEKETEVESEKVHRHYQISVRFKVRGKKNLDFQIVKIGKEEQDVRNVQLAKAMVSQVKNGEFKIRNIQTRQNQTPPPKPYTTQTLLADAQEFFKHSVAHSVKILDKLYKGVRMGGDEPISLITYYLSVSDFVKPESIAELREYIYNNYGTDYLPQSAYKQNRHHPEGEAIRPLDLRMTPRKLKKHLTEQQYDIYSMIWHRYIASQMSKSVSEITTISVSDDKEDPCICEYEYETDLFRGFRQVLPEKSNVREVVKIPDTWNTGKELEVVDFDIQTHQSEISNRYSEPEMLHLWLASGTGSIYEYLYHSGMLFAIQMLERKRSGLYPSAKGFYAINALLLKYSGYINTGIVLQLDNSIRTVASGKQTIEVFINSYSKLFEHGGSVQAPVTIGADGKSACPLCGGKLLHGDDNKIICEHYPASCVYIYKADNKEEKEICEICGAPLTVREGQYGRFLACTRYPKCDFTKAYTLNISCPVDGCDGKVVERQSKGRLFYGCSRYPDCSFAAWKKPVNMLCRNCGNRYLVEHDLTEDHKGYQCPKCNHLYDDQFISVISEK